jgi:hypothetical protein
MASPPASRASTNSVSVRGTAAASAEAVNSAAAPNSNRRRP